MKEDSRDFAVDAGDDIRETRMAWLSGIEGGKMAVTWIEEGSSRLA